MNSSLWFSLCSWWHTVTLRKGLLVHWDLSDQRLPGVGLPRTSHSEPEPRRLCDKLVKRSGRGESWGPLSCDACRAPVTRTFSLWAAFVLLWLYITVENMKIKKKYYSASMEKNTKGRNYCLNIFLSEKQWKSRLKLITEKQLFFSSILLEIVSR